MTRFRNGGDVFRKRELRIEDDSKVTNRIRARYSGAGERNGIRRKLRALVLGAKEEKFSL